MSGNALDPDPLFSMSHKTPAQIISEAKASIYDPGIKQIIHIPFHKSKNFKPNSFPKQILAANVTCRPKL